MSKSDKELTVEVVTSYLDAWSGQNKVPPKQNELPNLIQMIYKTIHNLEKSEKE